MLEAPATVPVSLYVGHGQDRSRWSVPAEHIVEFSIRGPGGVVDQRSMIAMGGMDGDAALSFAEPGTHVIGLVSRNSKSDLAADRFNAYVEKEGLASIAAFRMAGGTMQTSGREFYSRRAKSIMQVGPVTAASIDQVTMPLGHELEIVPERHPQTLGKDGRLPVRILYRGEPLVGALVKLTDLDDDAEPAGGVRTDANGQAAFALPRTGRWQLNVVWGVPMHDNPDAEFQTIFASLSFANG